MLDALKTISSGHLGIFYPQILAVFGEVDFFNSHACLIKPAFEPIRNLTSGHNTAQDETLVKSNIGRRITPALWSNSGKLLPSPNGVGDSSKPINCESLYCKQNHGDLDNDKLLGLRDDAERNDESRRPRGRMTYPQQCHKRASSRERERRGEQPWAMDTGVYAKRWARGYRKRESGVATYESNCVPQDGITRAGDFSQWGKEKEIRSGAEGWKDKGASSKKGEQAEQSYSDEAVYADIDSPHQTWRKVLQEPFHTHVREHDPDMLESVVLSARIVMFIY